MKKKEQLNIIRFTRKDLIKAQENCSIENISITYFKGSIQQIYKADMVLFSDNGKTITLKDRLPHNMKLPRKLKKNIKKLKTYEEKKQAA